MQNQPPKEPIKNNELKSYLESNEELQKAMKAIIKSISELLNTIDNQSMAACSNYLETETVQNNLVKLSQEELKTVEENEDVKKAKAALEERQIMQIDIDHYLNLCCLNKKQYNDEEIKALKTALEKISINNSSVFITDLENRLKNIGAKAEDRQSPADDRQNASSQYYALKKYINFIKETTEIAKLETSLKTVEMNYTNKILDQHIKNIMQTINKEYPTIGKLYEVLEKYTANVHEINNKIPKDKDFAQEGEPITIISNMILQRGIKEGLLNDKYLGILKTLIQPLYNAFQKHPLLEEMNKIKHIYMNMLLITEALKQECRTQKITVTVGNIKQTYREYRDKYAQQILALEKKLNTEGLSDSDVKECTDELNKIKAEFNSVSNIYNEKSEKVDQIIETQMQFLRSAPSQTQDELLNMLIKEFKDLYDKSTVPNPDDVTRLIYAYTICAGKTMRSLTEDKDTSSNRQSELFSSIVLSLPTETYGPKNAYSDIIPLIFQMAPENPGEFLMACFAPLPLAKKKITLEPAVLFQNLCRKAYDDHKEKTLIELLKDPIYENFKDYLSQQGIDNDFSNTGLRRLSRILAPISKPQENTLSHYELAKALLYYHERKNEWLGIRWFKSMSKESSDIIDTIKNCKDDTERYSKAQEYIKRHGDKAFAQALLKVKPELKPESKIDKIKTQNM